MVKHLVGADSKIGNVRYVRDILLKSPTDKLKTYNLPYKEVCSRTYSPIEKQWVADIPHQSLSCLHQSRDEDQTGRIAPLSNNHDPSTKPRVVNHRADSLSLTPFGGEDGYS